MNTTINSEISNINEDVLYNSLCFLTFDQLLECLLSIGYENDMEEIGNQKSDLVNRLVNDARELGIEDFIQRLNFETVTETCSLLSLSGVNSGDTDEEILENSRKQLEDKMKKDSLDQFFYSLTPHILSQFCNCLKINLPSPTNNNNNNNNNDGDDDNQSQEEEEQEEIIEEETSKTITKSIPSIKVGSDGTTVLSTLSTKSTFKRYKNRGISYGDSIVEGVFYENIIRLVKDEILLTGVENLFSLISKPKLLIICESLKVIIKPQDKMSDIIMKITSKLFNISVRSSISSSLNINEDYQDINNNNQVPKNTNILQYPKTPSDISENDDISSNSNNDDNNKDNSEKKEKEETEEEEEEEEEEKEKEEKEKIIKNKNKRKIDHDEITDDSEIDQPAKRPSIGDIKLGITKEDLSCYLVKDLRQWLQKKGLKYSDKKSILENRILKFLQDENDATSASESELSSASEKSREKKNNKTPLKKLKSNN